MNKKFGLIICEILQRDVNKNIFRYRLKDILLIPRAKDFIIEI